MNKLEMVNMNKLKDNPEALEQLYLISPLQCEVLEEVAGALKILSKEYERETKDKCIESDENLQIMALEYIRACHNAEEVFSNAVKTLELSGYKF